VTPVTCRQMFRVAALRDGRLEGSARRNFQRHLGSCATCTREAAALDRLAERVRAGLDDGGTTDDLRVWRERTRLLAAFDQALLSPRGAGPSARRLLWPLTAALLVGAIFLFWRARPPGGGAHGARATIQADGGAVWFRRPGAGDREEVTLRRGTLWIHVDRAAGERPLLVLLPDGELEDLGTTFTVSAAATETTGVSVQEGRVALRLRGRPPLDIGAGQVWPSNQPGSVPPAAPRAVAAPAAPRPPETPRRTERSPPRVARASHPPPGDSTAVPSDPLLEFRAAAAALRAGDNPGAAVAFTRFLAEHRDDPMAEDAAYLRVIAFQRMGAAGDLKRAAQAYLQRFPSGFRRAEVSRLAR